MVPAATQTLLMEPQTTKPTWLQNLETESWQAELIVSGVAIYGTFQLPDLLEGLIDWALYHVPDSLSYVSFFFFFYLFIGVVALIVLFVTHFILRALWVGLLGLVSVFPEPKEMPKMDMVSEHYAEQVFGDFGNVNAFVQQLDRIASVFFALTFGLAGVFFGLGFTILVAMVLAYIIGSLIPGVSPLAITYVLLGLLGSLIFLVSVLNVPALRDGAFARSYHYPLVKLMNRIVYNVAYRPMGYIQYLFSSYAGMKRYLAYMMLPMLVVLTLTLPLVFRSDITYLLDKVYVRLHSRTDRVYATAYADELPAGTILYGSLIPSQTIRDTRGFRLFVPLPQRAEELIMATCTGLDNTDDRDVRRQRRLECVRDYLRIRLADRVLTDYRLKNYTHPHAGEEGVLIVFPELPVQPGENVLTIEHGYRVGEEQKIERIPFFYLGAATPDMGAASDTLLQK